MVEREEEREGQVAVDVRVDHPFPTYPSVSTHPLPVLQAAPLPVEKGG